MRGSEATVIEFNEIDVTNCYFNLKVLNVTDSEQKPIDASIGTLVQPQLVEEISGEPIFRVQDFGKLFIQTDDILAQGKHDLRLIINTLESGESRSLDFKLLIVPCISVPSGVETKTYSQIRYSIGEPRLELPPV